MEPVKEFVVSFWTRQAERDLSIAWQLSVCGQHRVVEGLLEAERQVGPRDAQDGPLPQTASQFSSWLTEEVHSFLEPGSELLSIFEVELKRNGFEAFADLRTVPVRVRPAPRPTAPREASPRAVPALRVLAEPMQDDTGPRAIGARLAAALIEQIESTTWPPQAAGSPLRARDEALEGAQATIEAALKRFERDRPWRDRLN